MTPSERSTRYAPESIANAPMMRPVVSQREFDPCDPPVLFAARYFSGLPMPGTTLPWIYDPIGGEG